MESTKQKNSKLKIVTHSGRFHADEVFSCAALSMFYNGEIEIVRSRDPHVLQTSDILVDVGGEYDGVKKFDHHQSGGAGAHENGIPYSSFGLIWKHYGEKLAGSAEVAQSIDERLVQPIDAGDNGVETFSLVDETAPYLLQDAISIFGPTWNEKRTEDEGFFEVLEFAKKILSRAIVREQGAEEGKRIVEDVYQKSDDKRVIVLDSQYPWHQALSAHPEPLYAVLPDRGETGNWKVEAVRDDPHSFQNRKSFPLSWGGKQGKELAEISGVADAVFCHNNRFVAAAHSKEGALKLAMLAANA